ncbi:hypothetical protein ROA7023_03414 [Roseisalinus antarcticus]|uniref:Uncharacterized protein n=1 Tax=Roseisalinus antarcticus TaxID=254357 RepID=A0A1Y5TWY0_9RHOB|nr:hypothetical protein ROA7023_03414 [Roseisalinus antarcticus]
MTGVSVTREIDDLTLAAQATTGALRPAGATRPASAHPASSCRKARRALAPRKHRQRGGQRHGADIVDADATGRDGTVVEQDLADAGGRGHKSASVAANVEGAQQSVGRVAGLRLNVVAERRGKRSGARDATAEGPDVLIERGRQVVRAADAAGIGADMVLVVDQPRPDTDPGRHLSGKCDMGPRGRVAAPSAERQSGEVPRDHGGHARPDKRHAGGGLVRRHLHPRRQHDGRPGCNRIAPGAGRGRLTPLRDGIATTAARPLFIPRPTTGETS